MLSEKKAGFIWLISGPSGSGKTTLCEALLKDPFWSKKIVKSVSWTTRGPRPGEKKGQDYCYVSKDRFDALAAGGGFLEQETIFGERYGTPKSFVTKTLAAKKEPLLCIDVKGACRVRRIFGKKAVLIFIQAPQGNALERRLSKRSTETKKDIAKRLRRAKIEFSYLRRYEYSVLNDNFNDALMQLKAILTAKHCEVK